MGNSQEIKRLPVMAAALTIMLMAGACGEHGRSTNDTSAVAPTGGLTGVPAPETNPAESPQSTFAMDVDTASYDYARNLIGQGSVPAPETVRPEEFINAFRHPYPQPVADGFSITMDGARLPDRHHASPEGDVRLLRVGLQTRTEDAVIRQDARLTFVVDVSGSMADEGKLNVVKDALRAYAEQARPTDEVAIVTFSDEARLIREMSPVQDRDGLLTAVDRLKTSGGTNLERGLTRGYEVARAGFRDGATNRVVLVSDALANIGETAASPILAQVREAAAKQITLLGVGVGNDYGDQLMEQLADNGDGFTVYISGTTEAREVFVHQLPASLPVRALDAKTQVTFDESTVAGYRLIGYDNRRLDAGEFRDDSVDGGEVMAGHSVTALYLVRLRPEANGTVAHTQLRWQDPQSREPREAGADITTASLNGTFTESAAGLQVSYVAGWFAEHLRHSDHAAEITRPDLLSLADTAAARAGDPAVTELAALIRRAGD